MRTSKDILWTWLQPDEPKAIDRKKWVRHGGKWIVFDGREAIETLGRKLAPFIDAGEIDGAKFWNGDPSAINVYSLDRDRWKVRNILKTAGARHVLVWEYDYALGKNILRPLTFTYSWYSKFRTILASYGLAGTLRLIRETFRPRDSER